MPKKRVSDTEASYEVTKPETVAKKSPAKPAKKTPKKETPKKETPKKETPKKETPKKETTQTEKVLAPVSAVPLQQRPVEPEALVKSRSDSSRMFWEPCAYRPGYEQAAAEVLAATTPEAKGLAEDALARYAWQWRGYARGRLVAVVTWDRYKKAYLASACKKVIGHFGDRTTALTEAMYAYAEVEALAEETAAAQAKGQATSVVEANASAIAQFNATHASSARKVS